LLSISEPSLRRVSCLLTIVLAGALTAHAQVSGAARSPVPAPRAVQRPGGPRVESKQKVEAEVVLKRFAAAWRGENLSVLLAAFGDRRISIDVGGAARAGEYGPSQIYFLFKRLFDRTETRKFELNRHRAGGDAPHAVYDWRYVDERTGAVRGTRLLISVRPEAGAWVIDEIRADRRR